MGEMGGRAGARRVWIWARAGNLSLHRSSCTTGVVVDGGAACVLLAYCFESNPALVARRAENVGKWVPYER